MSLLAATRAPAPGIAVPRAVGLALGLVATVALVAAVEALASATTVVVALGGVAGLVLCAAVLARPMIGLYALTLAVPLEGIIVPGGGTLLSPAKALIVLTGLAAGGRLLLTRTGQRWHLAHLAFGVLLADLALGTLVAEDAFTVAKILVIWTAVFLISLHVALLGPREVRRILACLVVSGGVVGGVALVTQRAQQLTDGGAVVSGRAQAVFAHPGVLAFFLVLQLPVALVLAVGGPRRLRPLMVVCAVIAAVALLLTLTRSAIIGAGCGLLLLGLLSSSRRVLLVVALGTVAALTTASSLSGELGIVAVRLATVSDGLDTGGQRAEIWAVTPRIIADHPLLGVGAGNFGVVSSRYGLHDVDTSTTTLLPFDHAHNVPLTIAAEQGIPGLAALAVFALGCLSLMVRAVRGRGIADRQLALGLTAALLGLAVVGATDFPVRTDVIVAAAMIDVGALIALVRHGA
jgi:putative inorganic carbon (HCO3(-)) transporter